jgi:phospholipase/carboxylesterase
MKTDNREVLMDDDRIQAAIISELHLKFAVPEGEGPFPVILMLHGWTGDENSMWIFASKMPEGSLLISPRGLFPSALGGYGWYRDSVGGLPELGDFAEAIDLIEAILMSDRFSMGDFSRIKMVGFSQGAALVYSLAFRQAYPLTAVAGLSGFVPGGVEDLIEGQPLSGLPVFVAHGTKDQIVPVGRARQGTEVLKKAGAQVTYCEDDVGHRLSASCFRGLKEFFSRYS